MINQSDRFAEPAPKVGARGITFESRIAIAALATSALVLLLASSLFMVAQWQAERSQIRRHQGAVTEILASGLAADLARSDRPAAARLLEGAAVDTTVRSAEARDAAGALVASYHAAAPDAASDRRLTRTLLHGGRPIGTLSVAVEEPSVEGIAARYLAVCAALFFSACGIGLFMGRWLARRVMDPVNRLSRAMQEVTDSGDYAQTLPLWAADEFGRLTESFNHLLAQLNANDKALHRAMTDLVSARDAAETANVLKSQFLANMSHEIRTPLNGVLAMAQVISLGELTGVQRNRVEVIRRSGEDLLAILNDILDLSKIEAGKMEIEEGELDAGAVARGVLETFRALADSKPKLAFSLEIEPTAAGTRRGDAARFGQILNNLVSNALKFTSEGRVDVRMAGVGPDGADGLVIEVADTGIGIAEDKLPLLFEKFSQADGSNTRRFGGTGLGLAISRELCRLMGGEITVSSCPGEGSHFTVSLPFPRLAEDELSDRFSEPRGPAPELPARPLRVLAAEDIPTNQLVLRTIMDSFGVSVHIVENGREAVKAWAEGDFDLILMDIQMPEMDGLDATRAIRASEAATGRRRTPILAVSANAMTHQVRDYLAVGMDGHVAKPIELSRLHGAIQSVVGAGLKEAAA